MPIATISRVGALRSSKPGSGRKLRLRGLALIRAGIAKADIAALLIERHSISKEDAKALVNSIFAASSMQRRATAPRAGRNPATGETIQIAASMRMGFTPAKALNDRLKG